MRAAWVAAALLAAAVCAAQAQVPQVVERVEVSRVVLDVHVLADDGQPVMGLEEGDLRVSVDGRTVRIESLRWTTASVAIRDAIATPPGAPSAPAPGDRPGRLILLFFQKDLDASRVEGLMAMLRQAEALVAGLAPDDRVAVALFHHHLEMLSDFTTDRANVSRVLTRGVLFEGRADEAASGQPPVLLPAFDHEAGRRASSMEQALLVLGRALDRLPGAKSMVLFGHGFGRVIGGRSLAWPLVSFDSEYTEARRLLARARTTVYCLDLTRADSHTLEAGLMRVAEDTGGFYMRTHEFPGQALSRLGEAMGGHYELSFEKPDLPRGEHVFRIELIGRKGTIFARRTYVG